MHIERIAKNSSTYPKRLNYTPSPPACLNVLGGNLAELLTMPAIGVVGSRKVTNYGRGLTEKLTEELAQAGVCIISGLALGVDSIAHRATLKVKGKTIAVLPSGLKSIYPVTHRDVAKEILEKGGVLVSEYEDDFRPRRESFIQRNRIIAGLSDALLITEAAEKSGSLHTANFALEMGKTVLAVPGNVTSPTSAGTNNLLKAGAILVTSAQDIFDAMQITPEKVPDRQPVYGDNEQESLILNLLSNGIARGDELFSSSKLPVSLFQQTLTMLEIKGQITPLGNNTWRLRS